MDKKYMLPATVALLTAIFLLLFIIPQIVGRMECNSCKPAEIAKAIADARAAFIQLSVAVAGAGTIFFTWRNYVRSSQESRENLTLAREGRTSDNFIKAVEQLGSSSPAVRAGGVFGLGRLLRSAKVDGDYWPVMDVLTASVREWAKRGPQPRATKPSQEIQAALNVLARRTDLEIPDRRDDSPVDLHDTDLSMAWLSGGHYEWAYFGSTLLIGADLSHARFDNASMHDVNLSSADVRGAFINEADLRGAILDGANLTNSIMTDANLSGASLIGVTLVGVDLGKANLSGANLSGSDLSGADLSDADLEGAVISPSQVSAARGNSKTKLPPACPRPSNWPA